MDDLQSTFLILSASFSSTSYCFPIWDNFKNRSFLLGPSCLCCCTCVHSRKRKLAVVFPPSVTPFHVLKSRAVMYSERGTFLNVSRSGYIWFQSRPRNQESTNDSPCLVEGKSRNITRRIMQYPPRPKNSPRGIFEPIRNGEIFWMNNTCCYTWCVWNLQWVLFFGSSANIKWVFSFSTDVVVFHITMGLLLCWTSTFLLNSVITLSTRSL